MSLRRTQFEGTHWNQVQQGLTRVRTLRDLAAAKQFGNAVVKRCAPLAVVSIPEDNLLVEQLVKEDELLVHGLGGRVDPGVDRTQDACQNQGLQFNAERHLWHGQGQHWVTNDARFSVD